MLEFHRIYNAAWIAIGEFAARSPRHAAGVAGVAVLILLAIALT